MQELIEMSQAHLTNVRNEIERLKVEQSKIQQEIEKLQNYLNESLKAVQKYIDEQYNQ